MPFQNVSMPSISRKVHTLAIPTRFCTHICKTDPLKHVFLVIWISLFAAKKEVELTIVCSA